MSIDEKLTYEKYGYYSRDLKPRSGKKIVAVCDKCGGIRIVRKAVYYSICKVCASTGRTHTKESREKMSAAQKGRKTSDETRRKISEAKTGFRHTEETKKKIGDAFRGKKGKNYGKPVSKETRKKISKKLRGRKLSEEHKENIRKGLRGRKNEKSKPELKFEEICIKFNLPFRYVGDASLWIGSKKGKKLNPDFIEANGKKVIVEIMGRYWHSPLINPKIREDAKLLYREKHYKKHGWKTIFIWDTDLERKDAEEFVLSLFKK